jgi:hypothetical protein
MSGLLFTPLTLLFAAAGRLADPLHPPQVACSRQATHLPRRQVDPLRSSRTTEYHGSTNYHIQHLTFSTTRCYGHCPVFTLQIDSSAASEKSLAEKIASGGCGRASNCFMPIIPSSIFISQKKISSSSTARPCSRSASSYPWRRCL